MAALITVTVTQNDLVKVGANIVRGLERALRMEAEDILTAAKILTPVDRGWLHGSGQVQGPYQALASYEIFVTFGDAATPYALYVHEDLKARHASPTQAKFLETPAKHAIVGMATRLVVNAGRWG